MTFDILHAWLDLIDSEESRQDLVEADHMFALAIAFSDNNNSDDYIRALTNRNTTAENGGTRVGHFVFCIPESGKSYI